MCVICIKEKGVEMPTKADIAAMWARNPDGAGYMFARGEAVEIRKGFAKLEDFQKAIEAENFGPADSVVLHFRISTQAGKRAAMTHPFPLSTELADMEALTCSTQVGVAHNGIIDRTADAQALRFSDTALFVTKYLSHLVKAEADLYDPALLEAVEALAPYNRFAFLLGNGDVATVGDFQKVGGLLYSNLLHNPAYAWENWKRQRWAGWQELPKNTAKNGKNWR